MAWLNPLDFGSLLHDLLCDFMQALTDGNELPAARHIPALQALARERTEAQKDVTPVTTRRPTEPTSSASNRPLRSFSTSKSARKTPSRSALKSALALAKADHWIAPSRSRCA